MESLEPPKVVHARCPDMVSKGNMYGQVTVRMHSRQVRQTVANTRSVTPKMVVVILEYCHDEPLNKYMLPELTSFLNC